MYAHSQQYVYAHFDCANTPQTKKLTCSVLDTWSATVLVDGIYVRLALLRQRHHLADGDKKKASLEVIDTSRLRAPKR